MYYTEGRKSSLNIKKNIDQLNSFQDVLIFKWPFLNDDILELLSLCPKPSFLAVKNQLYCFLCFYYFKCKSGALKIYFCTSLRKEQFGL